MKSSLWCEDYRPKSIDDCILPERLKNQFNQFVENGEITSLLLSGPAGTGKTSVAKAFCNDLNCDSIIINCSEDSGIDILRTKIRDFASTVSLMSDSKHKIVILDEADYLNPNSTMPALRGFIEEFWGNCRFIFTCNYLNKIIDPLLSRCSVVEFQYTKEEKTKMMMEFYTRVSSILDENEIPSDKKVLVQFINHHFPDMRRILNELQRYSMCGEIDVGVLTSVDSSKFEELIGYLKDKNFKAMREWVTAESADPTSIYTKLYETASKYVKPETIPSLVVLLGEYGYKSAFSMNTEINLAACFTEIMAECEFL